MDDSGNVAEKREQHVQPKVLRQSHLKKDPERWKKNGEQYAYEIHLGSFPSSINTESNGFAPLPHTI